MMGAPLARPLAWTWAAAFFLQEDKIGREMRSDCMAHPEVLR